MVENDQIYEIIELAKSTGKIRKGLNEVTKSLERGEAKLVIVADDISPKEIAMHIPLLAKEKNIKCFKLGTKEELGVAAGVSVPTSAIAVVKEGEARKLIEQLKGE